MDFVDLRSDTVTRPTQAMRQAMANAEVGDDVFGDDPTVNRLQELAASMLGRQAALFMPSGTMANQICLNLLTKPGDEVICYRHAHVYRHEGAAGSAWSGLSFWPLDAARGILDPHEVADAVLDHKNPHNPKSRVLAIENTSNRGNGNFYTLDRIQALCAVARDQGLKCHLDGARMFHACAAGGYAPHRLAENFDTISFCLSKGLGAPVGSMVVGSRATINQAVHIRKRMGGGMRQVGILAAAAIHALEHHVERLVEDHVRAARLAHGLAAMKKVELNPAHCPTNIVIFDIKKSGITPLEAVEELRNRGVGSVVFGPTHLRMVTHLDITDQGIEHAIKACAELFD